jgi:hypothetical protein
MNKTTGLDHMVFEKILTAWRIIMASIKNLSGRISDTLLQKWY